MGELALEDVHVHGVRRGACLDHEVDEAAEKVGKDVVEDEEVQVAVDAVEYKPPGAPSSARSAPRCSNPAGVAAPSWVFPRPRPAPVQGPGAGLGQREETGCQNHGNHGSNARERRGQ